MKTIIAGSREIIDYNLIEKSIAKSCFSITEIVSGCAKGVDSLALDYAKANNIPFATFPVSKQDWEDHPKIAGFLRNEKMADYAEALIAIWDGKSPGTKDMIQRARNKGLKVYIHRTDYKEEIKQRTLF